MSKGEKAKFLRAFWRTTWLFKWTIKKFVRSHGCNGCNFAEREKKIKHVFCNSLTLQRQYFLFIYIFIFPFIKSFGLDAKYWKCTTLKPNGPISTKLSTKYRHNQRSVTDTMKQCGNLGPRLEVVLVKGIQITCTSLESKALLSNEEECGTV